MTVIIDYTNWKGERRTRRITPTGGIRFGTSSFHPEPGWLIEAIDQEKLEKREFSLENIHSWKEDRPPRKYVMFPSEEDGT